MGVQVVWFKRDLRVLDHEPLLDGSSRSAWQARKPKSPFAPRLTFFWVAVIVVFF